MFYKYSIRIFLIIVIRLFHTKFLSSNVFKGPGIHCLILSWVFHGVPQNFLFQDSHFPRKKRMRIVVTLLALALVHCHCLMLTLLYDFQHTLHAQSVTATALDTPSWRHAYPGVRFETRATGSVSIPKCTIAPGSDRYDASKSYAAVLFWAVDGNTKVISSFSLSPSA